MLVFSARGVPSNDRAAVERALFEIGCRLGIEFTVARDANDIPSSAISVLYGPGAPAATRANEVTLPCLGSSERCGPVGAGSRIWGRSGADAVDAVAGVADLLAAGEGAESGVPSSLRSRYGGSFDGHGNHPLAVASMLETPVIEYAVKRIREEIAKQGFRLPPPANPWGAPGRYAAVVSHDIDGPRLHTIFSLLRSALYAVRGCAKEGEALEIGLVTKLTGARDPYWNFDEWLRLERMLGIRSTFYFYVDRAGGARRDFNDPRYDIRTGPFPEILRNIVRAGSEVGIHTGIKAHSATSLVSAKETLETVIGTDLPNMGARAHYWAIDWRNPYDSWKLFEEAGIRHDASLSPQTMGFRLGSALPLLPGFGRRAKPADGIVALPTALMDAYVTEAAYGGNLASRIARARSLIEATRQVGGICVLDWHCRTLANRGPWRNYLFTFLACAEHLIDDSDASFTTAGEAATMWRTHVQRFYRPTAALL